MSQTVLDSVQLGCITEGGVGVVQASQALHISKSQFSHAENHVAAHVLRSRDLVYSQSRARRRLRRYW